MLNTLALLLCTLSTDAQVFLLPDDIRDSQNVRLIAEVPEPGLALIEKDTSRPQLWYAPVASHTAADGVRLWYQRVNKGETEYVDQRTLCVGTIRDGQWHVPTLHETPPAWGGGSPQPLSSPRGLGR